MKARVIPTTPTALYYALGQESGVQAREILPRQLSQPVGLLAGGSGKAAAPDPAPAPAVSLLLMADFSEELLNGVLDDLHAANEQVSLKAVVTKHNRTWSVRALIEELLREKNEMEKRNET